MLQSDRIDEVWKAKQIQKKFELASEKIRNEFAKADKKADNKNKQAQLEEEKAEELKPGTIINDIIDDSGDVMVDDPVAGIVSQDDRKLEEEKKKRDNEKLDKLAEALAPRLSGKGSKNSRTKNGLSPGGGQGVQQRSDCFPFAKKNWWKGSKNMKNWN